MVEVWWGHAATWWAWWAAHTTPHTTYATAAAALIAAWLVWRTVRPIAHHIATARAARRPRDPLRLYTTAQRNAAAAVCGYRCEGARRIRVGRKYRRLHPLRCRTRTAGNPNAPGGLALFAAATEDAHGDHHYPHARGGATSPGNLVTLCATCNLAKGATPPTWWDTRTIAYRRRRYYPRGTPRRPGEYYRAR